MIVIFHFTTFFFVALVLNLVDNQYFFYSVWYEDTHLYWFIYFLCLNQAHQWLKTIDEPQQKPVAYLHTWGPVATCLLGATRLTLNVNILNFTELTLSQLQSASIFSPEIKIFWNFYFNNKFWNEPSHAEFPVSVSAAWGLAWLG